MSLGSFTKNIACPWVNSETASHVRKVAIIDSQGQGIKDTKMIMVLRNMVGHRQKTREQGVPESTSPARSFLVWDLMFNYLPLYLYYGLTPSEWIACSTSVFQAENIAISLFNPPNVRPSTGLVRAASTSNSAVIRPPFNFNGTSRIPPSYPDDG